MIVKLKQVKAADNALKKILSAPMDQKLAYRISKILKKLVPHLDKIDDMGNALVRKHGTLNNGRYSVSPEKMEDYGKDFMEFLEDPTEITAEPIPFEMLEQTGLKFTPDDMIALESLIEEPKEETVV